MAKNFRCKDSVLRYLKTCLHILGIGFAVNGISGCVPLPSLESRTVSAAFTDTHATRLGMAIVPRAAAHANKSGIYALTDARDAFAARILLAQAAERSLDVQYYIWQQDMSGTLLFKALHDAAKRGVRVRLLLDDNNTTGLDRMLSALDAHPNIEIRLFNPFVTRCPRWVGYLTDFARLNRRMHNKSFTADNQVTIIGGRNVGDEYFGATDGLAFVDLDVLAVGPVVRDVSSDFDRYWTSESSYPVDRLLPPASATLVEELATIARRIETSAAAVAYMNALRASPLVRELLDGQLALEWAATYMVSDDPAKGLDRAAPHEQLPQKLQQIIGKPATNVELVSAYFVPTAAGVDAFTALAERGVKIRILTNSFEATDVAVVHAGYAKHRKPLLEAGIKLYERQRLSADHRAKRGAGLGSSSASSLHAKTFSVDGSRVFIGSFNFDPRSARLNTEMGFVIDSPSLAQKIEARFNNRVPVEAYEVRLSDTADLYWIERRGDEAVRHDSEPGTSYWQRTGIWFLSLLPIEWLL